MSFGQISYDLPSYYRSDPVLNPIIDVPVDEKVDSDLVVYEPEEIKPFIFPTLNKSITFELLSNFTRDVVKIIYDGRIVSADRNGNLQIRADSRTDIHHITEQHLFRKIPGSKVLDTFEDRNYWFIVMDVIKSKYGQYKDEIIRSNMRDAVFNLVLTTYDLHHTRIHAREDKRLKVFRTQFGDFKLEDTLRAFAVFNSADRLKRARKHTEDLIIEELERDIPREYRFYQFRSVLWSLDLITDIAQEYRLMNPKLYELWKHYIFNWHNLNIEQ